MGLSELNFDFGFIGLFLFLGPPLLLLFFCGWFIEKIISGIESVRFKTDTPDGFMEFLQHLDKKFTKQRLFEERFPTFTKLRTFFSVTLILIVFVTFTFLWGWFVLIILE